MAKNRVQDGKHLTLVAAALSGKKSGDPVAVGSITGIALGDATTGNECVIDTEGVYKLLVKGVDGAGNKAIAIGDPVYFDAGDINADVTNGTLFGYALGAVASASATTTIPVLLKK